MKEVLKSILDKAGYRILDKASLLPEDLRGEVDHPLLAKYLARRHTFLLKANFKKCIVLFRFSCEKNGNNPLVNTVTDYIENEYVSYSGSKLERFFTDYTPNSVAERFNLDGKTDEGLLQFPPVFTVFPWEKANMKARKKFREGYVKVETGQRGRELTLDHGWGCFGPISQERGELKMQTLIGLTKSIREKGYLRGDGPEEDILASVLINGNDYKYLIKNGTHRLAVLSALDYKSAPIRVLPTSIPAFIYRREVDYWPKVRDGLYTREQALKIFDNIFKGDGNY